MGDNWSSRLSEYVDDDLTADERAELETHLGSCDECRVAVAELREVAGRAHGLEPVQPPRDLWPDIHDRIRGSTVVALDERRERRARRVTFSMPQLAAAAVVLLAVGAGAMRVFSGPTEAGPVAAVAPAGLIAPAAATAMGPDVSSIIEDLQFVLDEHRSRLDSATVRVLEENLATIDRAIAEARAALEADPANHYLNAHLAATLRTKVRLLNQAAALISAAS
jgi:anti-sigma factor RsiW